jgi:hypothetical protein
VKIVLTIVVFLLIINSSIIQANGLHGSASFKYELADYNPGQSWKIDLHYDFQHGYTLGVSETTFTNGYETLFETIPAFVPSNQLYEAYFQIRFNENISIKISQWCNHPVYSGNNIENQTVPQGTYFEGKYEF